MRVAIIGCGLIGAKRARALCSDDEIVAVYDPNIARAQQLAFQHKTKAKSRLEDVLEEAPEAVIVSTVHSALAEITSAALHSGFRVLVEKPAARVTREVRELIRVQSLTNNPVAVGFNHRFNPAIVRALDLALSDRFGRVIAVRGRYGHGGRLGYEREWRMDPAVSGGGEFIDQGSHLVDLVRVLLGELPYAGGVTRRVFWRVPGDDSAVIILGESDPEAPYALLHVTCAEWKNTFEFEIWMEAAKIRVRGLQGSYGSPEVTLYEMGPDMGPPTERTERFVGPDTSWAAEWKAFRENRIGVPGGVGDLQSALYVHLIADSVYQGFEWRV